MKIVEYLVNESQNNTRLSRGMKMSNRMRKIENED